MNHSSERQSPGGSTALWCHWSSRWVFVNVPSFSVCAAAGSRNTSVAMSCVRSSPVSISGASRQNDALSISWRSRTTSQSSCAIASRCSLRVRGADRRVLAQQEEALHLAVAHVEHRRVGGVVAVDARQPVEAEVVARVAASPHHAFSRLTMYAAAWPQ